MEEEIPNFDFGLDLFSDRSDDDLLQDEQLQVEENIDEIGRFAVLQDNELNDILSGAEAKSTKKNTKWVIKTIEGKQKDSQFVFNKCLIVQFTSFALGLQIGVASAKLQSHCYKCLQQSWMTLSGDFTPRLATRTKKSTADRLFWVSGMLLRGILRHTASI